jgi:UDP-N-acetylmuramoyl-tripeptide--D-alanyl-D-alanine ligase
MTRANLIGKLIRSLRERGAAATARVILVRLVPVRRIRRRLRPILHGVAWVNRRLHPGVTVVGITGSAGKTTTKGLCMAVLSEFGQCSGSIRSQNHYLWTSRLIGGLRRSDRFCVAELAAYEPGAMDLAVRVARPDVAVMTLVGRDHYSAFRSLEAIAREKGRLVAGLPRRGVAVLNLDDPLVRQIGEECGRRVVWVGESEGATVRLLEARSVWPEPLLMSVAIQGATHRIRTRLHGTHMALSVLATLGVAVALDLPLDRVIAAIETVEPEDGRMQVVETHDGIVFLRDDWKAPEWSFRAPLEFLEAARASRKVAVVGTISDSPRSPSRRYPRAAREVRRVADLAVFVGPDSSKALTARAAPDDETIQAFPTLREARDYLEDALRPGDLVLLKGSNPADHLVRLVIDRSLPVLCWKSDCRKKAFCDRCPKVHEPASAEGGPPGARVGPEADTPGAADGAGVMPLVVAGLGNLGEEFRDTPHNAGHAVLDRLAASAGAAWEEHDEGAVSYVRIRGERVALLKPGVPMNRSGAAVGAFLRRVGSGPRGLLVVHDEMDLEMGRVRPKPSGGDAGHRGVRSIITALGTEEFGRIRIGVRPPGDRRRARQLVLDGTVVVEAALDAAYAEAISLIRHEFEARLAAAGGGG